MPEKRETNYIGINYGRLSPEVNVDTKTGIHYGVISVNEIFTTWCEVSEPNYGPPTCPFCGSPAIESPDPAYSNQMECTECIETFSSDSCHPEDPSYEYNYDGYSMIQDDYNDIFVIKSPFYTYAQYCSPCAPGACHLSFPLSKEAITNGQNRCYCLGHDWFDDNHAPYDVYRVNDMTYIPPPQVLYIK